MARRGADPPLALEDARRELGEIGTALGPALLDRIGKRTDAQFREGLSDVIHVTFVLGEALAKGHQAWERFHDWLPTAEVGETPPPGVGADLVAAKVLYKAFFFMVRAFQDRIYEVLFELKESHRPNPEGLMREALNNPRNPVGALLREQAETDYFDWFGPFRDKRNDLKDGVRASWGSSGGEFGIVLGRLDELETIYMGPVLGEADVLEALRQTTSALKVIRDWRPAK